MSSEVVIRAERLSKFYNVYRRPEDRIKQMLWRHRRRFFTPVVALRDVDLEVFRGETFGVIGRNGSGKSTLLQLICGTVYPSMGRLEVQGRVAALLELGAGFNPDFTGRENVFLSGAILGLSDSEIDARFDQIADFADIGEFIDQPVRGYSTGMFARLAFAVAISVDANILLVDEALAVGDEAFQRKCFARIDELKRSGVTVLFVSHATGTVLELCDRVMLVDSGECLMVGEPKEVVELYQRLIFAAPKEGERLRAAIKDGSLLGTAPAGSIDHSALAFDPGDEPGSDGAFLDPDLLPVSTTEYGDRGCRIDDVKISNENGDPVNVLSMGGTYTYSYRVTFTGECRRVRFGMLIKLTDGVEVGGVASHPPGEGIDVCPAGSSFAVSYRFRASLVPNVYFMNAGVMGDIEGEEIYLHRILDAVMFRVRPVNRNCITAHVDFSADHYCSYERLDDSPIIQGADSRPDVPA